ncbi:methionyl-tRNA formyltransferase [Chloroflexota bacterium]
MAKVKIAFLGVNNAGKRIYDWLVNSGEDVRCLLMEKEELKQIESIKPDIIVSCGFRYIVTANIRQIPSMGCINIHSSYLPYNRGANPNVWSIIEDTPAGVSIHFMDDGIDTGPIIARRKIKINFSDNARDVYQKLEDTQVELFREVWEQIKQGSINPIEQQKDEGTFHTVKDFKEICQIELDKAYTVRELLNRLRALTFSPYDNAYVIVDGEKFYLRLEVYSENARK